MRVELVAVGTELLLGDIVNGNAAWLGEHLAAAGIDVTHGVVVGDNIDRISDTLRTALGRADAVVVTGGIGPTQDDLTREALAVVAGVELVRDAELEAALRRRFEMLRRDVPEMNYRQADMPAGAQAISNAKGTAPGVRAEIGSGVIYALPGVPHEMQAMFDDAVLPDLLARSGEPAVIVNRVLHTAGVWESAVAAALGPLVEQLEQTGNPTIAFLASGGQTRVRITAKAATRDGAEDLVAPVEAQVRAALGNAIYGTGDDTLDVAVARLLRANGQTVAVAESLTGGMLGERLTSAAGASDVFRGGIIAYSTALKAELLGVPVELLASEGAVSARVAVAMAAGARERLTATYGVSLTGVAGPAEQDGQPVGTVHIGLAAPGGTLSRSVRMSSDRPRIRQFAVVAAMNLLRLHLLGDAPVDDPA
ncbi:MAG: competence/damage-inducible protein A [Mycobacteriales bacterium]